MGKLWLWLCLSVALYTASNWYLPHIHITITQLVNLTFKESVGATGIVLFFIWMFGSK